MPLVAALTLSLLCQPARPGIRLNTPDDRAMKEFRLTSENVRKAAAVAHRLAAEVSKDPALAQALGKKTGQAATLDGKAKALESEPRVASALRAESIGAREYVMVQLAVVQARMIATILAQGVAMDAATIGQAMNPANLEFVERHRKEMTQLQRSQEELEEASQPTGDANK
ncbi:MAG TPA: hypothetical protein VE964_05510 [Myxococcales bacterium]|nr:hypothetical protein [Myxococcales bacterium]